MLGRVVLSKVLQQDTLIVVLILDKVRLASNGGTYDKYLGVDIEGKFVDIIEINRVFNNIEVFSTPELLELVNKYFAEIEPQQ